jgi:hypothetical protein
LPERALAGEDSAGRPVRALSSEGMSEISYRRQGQAENGTPEIKVWFVLGKSSDPRVPGYAIASHDPFGFSKALHPKADLFQGAVMLPGWVHGPIAANFTTTQDPTVGARYKIGSYAFNYNYLL